MPETQDQTADDAAMAAMAAAAWEAWEGRPEDSDLVPTGPQFNAGPGQQLRMCLMVMHKTKPELVGIARSMWKEEGQQEGDQNMWHGFVSHIRSAKIFAECMLALATAAEARCLASVATLAAEEGDE